MAIAPSAQHAIKTKNPLFERGTDRCALGDLIDFIFAFS